MSEHYLNVLNNGFPFACLEFKSFFVSISFTLFQKPDLDYLFKMCQILIDLTSLTQKIPCKGFLDLSQHLSFLKYLKQDSNYNISND